MQNWAVAENGTVAGDQAAAHDVEHLRRQLAARKDECFERLEDAVSELVALHAVDAQAVFASVSTTIAAEDLGR